MASNIGHVNSIEAEFCAFMLALEKAQEMNLLQLWMETDSLAVVTDFHKDTGVPWQMRARWSNCMHFSRLINCTCTHTLWEGNMVADALAKNGQSLPSFSSQLGKSMMIRMVAHRCNPIVLGLVNTQHLSLTDEKVKGWWKKEDNVSWVDVPETCSNDEKSGGQGLVFSWNEQLFSKSKVLTNKRYILLEGKLIQEGLDVSFLLVHAPSCSQERFDLWRDLMNLNKSISTPLMMFGDFQEVLEPGEIKGNEVTSQGMKDFRHCIAEMNLVELPLLDRKFTWYDYANNRSGRIDRVFVDQEWLEHFKVLKLRGLERMLADHRPLLVQSGSVDDITSVCGT